MIYVRIMIVNLNRESIYVINANLKLCERGEIKIA